MEAAEKNSLMVEEAKSSSMAMVAVHKVSGRGQRNHGPRSSCCCHCGKSNHEDIRCLFWKSKCHRCGIVGHVSAMKHLIAK
ncbi:unnamed protein product [Acanthoscelides obtectus]|uniref:Uncharacterized protein n=1 Tax=Acanthoscelides obtectus TaxID=200917 RepID=A0A9P0K8Q4_ACAOB|nr:unnamed protein product [Acanthoscelides obtectus]CAK1643021.1 hypothetical protein AOBTE_LOCUS13372 [Acanthoscelides obtectus]